jgi:DNA repair protein SbcC/Rad50
MRLHRLELSAFLAFPGREVVDFDDLSEAGLFLLHGRTGAGKTSLLDAVCFALYGDVPGTRSGGARLRSDHAGPAVRTEVVLEATLRGQRIRVTRAPEQQRPKRRGDGVTTDAHAVSVVRIEDDGSEVVLATRHDEAARELADLLGMTREQFCQVVLLPQGGFARFLHAGSDERDRLLRELFDVGRFADVELWLRDRRQAEERALGSAMGAVRDAVSRAAQVAEADPPEGWAAEPDRAAAWLEERLVLAEAGEATAADAATGAEVRREAADGELVAGTALATRQAQAAVAARELAAWKAQRPERDRAADALAGARRAAPAQAHAELLRGREDAAARAGRDAAEAVAAAREAGVDVRTSESEVEGRLFDVDAAPQSERLRHAAAALRGDAGAARASIDRERDLHARETAVAELRERATAQAAEVERLDGELTAAQERRPALEARVAAAREAAARATGLREAARTSRQRATRGEERDRLAAQASGARERHAAARDAHAGARDAHAALLERRLEGIAAELAGRLRDGVPCAVCGAAEHPHPAAAPDGGLVDEARVRAARDEAERLGALREEAERELALLETRLAAAAAVAGEAPLTELRAAADAAADALSEAQDTAAGAGTAIAALGQLEEAIVELRRRRRDAEVGAARAGAEARQRSAALDADREAVSAARGGAPSIEARVTALLAAADAAEKAADALDVADRLTREADAARATALAAVAQAGFADLDALRAAARAPEEQASLEASVRAWDEGLATRVAAATREELAEAAAQPAPEVAALEAAAGEARAAAERARGELALARRRHGELRELHGRLDAALQAAEPVRERFAVARELSELASGGIGNRLRMRLSAYVLAARLEAVAAAASVRLQAMSAGRYALEHADDDARGNRRGGLDLRVVDAWTGRDRAPSSLSGGETFLASLALALGLADVVTAEAGGARLETLFVDEGFGSLDDEGTLDEVLAVLDELRDGGRAVGIVSHVAELRQRIPAQLRVERGRAGSRVVRPAAPVAA